MNPQLIGVYGKPTRDPRKHVISIFYFVKVEDFTTLRGGDDAIGKKKTIYYFVKNINIF